MTKMATKVMTKTKTKPTVSSNNDSIIFHIHALASSLSRASTSYYGAFHGLGLPEMRILSNLGREGPLAAHQLVELTVMDKALVSRVLAGLARRGLATSPPGVSRRRRWALSPAGRKLVKALRPVWRAREEFIVAGLSSAEHTRLLATLRRMFAAAEKLRADEAVKIQAARAGSGAAGGGSSST